MAGGFVGAVSVDVVDETLSVLFFIDVFQIVVLSRLMLSRCWVNGTRFIGKYSGKM